MKRMFDHEWCERQRAIVQAVQDETPLQRVNVADREIGAAVGRLIASALELIEMRMIEGFDERLKRYQGTTTYSLDGRSQACLNYDLNAQHAELLVEHSRQDIKSAVMGTIADIEKIVRTANRAKWRASTLELEMKRDKAKARRAARKAEKAKQEEPTE